jgi:hypothetical protein
MRLSPLLVCILLPVSPAGATGGDSGQPVHRCVGGHGETVFSGLPCAATGTASASAEASGLAVAAAPAGGPGGAPDAARACAASRDELRERVAAAIALRDANTLAGLMRWRGVGAGTADRRLRTLRDLVKRPLLAIEADTGDDAFDVAGPGWSADAEDAEDTEEVLHVRTGSGADDGVREHTFGVSLLEGCYWLTW